MSRAQERSSGIPAGAQAAQGAADPTGSGTTAGAGATGATTTAGTTTTAGGLHDQPSTTASYSRGTAPAAGYQPESAAAYDTGTSSGALGGTFMIVAGLLTFFAGLAAVVRTSYFHSVAGTYPYAWSVHSWGWAILILGALLFAVGACAMLGMSWARPVGVALAVLTVIASFMFLVYTPVWGVILLAVSVLAIWGLLRRDPA